MVKIDISQFWCSNNLASAGRRRRRKKRRRKKKKKKKKKRKFALSVVLITLLAIRAVSWR
jgi:hypothetical protein